MNSNVKFLHDLLVILFETLINLFIIVSFRDRIRTAVNVEGDAFGAGILSHLLNLSTSESATKLAKEDSAQELEEVKSESLGDQYKNSMQI